MKMTFFGAAQTVTGSRTLLEADGRKILIDAGLFQGEKKLRLKNWVHDFKASTLDAIILTHAHIDHSGFLPRLVKEGYNKPIYCSKPTKELCKFMLLDSAKLQEEDAGYANKTGYSHHVPAEPLYTIEDAQKTIRLLEAVEDEQWFSISKNIQFRLFRAGHILGARFIQLSFPTQLGSKTILFSGDLGNNRSALIKNSTDPVDSHNVVIESTYGDRLLPRTDIATPLAEFINKTINRGGIVIIPAFAVGRTQDLLHHIGVLKEKNLIPSNLPVYVDSPMGLEATKAHLKFPKELAMRFGDEGIEGPLNKDDYHCTSSVEESKALLKLTTPHVLIASSGMITGGRIMHHLKKRISDEKNLVLFVGFQAEGTKGRLLIEGEKRLRLHHEEIAVRAEIGKLNHLSAHADAQDIEDWLKKLNQIPEKIFINHGELKSQEALRERLQKIFPSSEILIPELGETFHLT
jgi:metallo-beta-lactamase family protein